MVVPVSCASWARDLGRFEVVVGVLGSKLFRIQRLGFAAEGWLSQWFIPKP